MRRELNGSPHRRSPALKIVALSYLTLAIYQRKFEKLGIFLARHQSAVLILSILMVLLSCCGFLRMGEERSVEYPFVMKDSQAEKDIGEASAHFPLLGARREEIILEAKSGKNVLTKHCLVEAVVIHRIVKSTKGFRTVCVRLRRSPSRKANSTCFVQSPLELAGPKASKLDDLTNIMAREMNNPKIILSSGRTFPFSVGEMLGDFKVGEGNKTVTARAIRMVYFVKPPKNNFQSDIILRMEEMLEKRLAILRAQTKCTSVSFMTVRMSDEGTTEPLQPDFWLLIISGAISMGSGIILTSLFCCSNWLVVSLLAFGCSILALVCSVGMAFLLGLQFSHTFWFLPFLLSGEAVTLALIVVRELENGGRAPSYRDCLARSGFLLGSTAVVDMAVFGIAVKSSFPGVSDFFLFAFFAVLFLFILFLIPFMVLLTLYIKRKKVIIQGGLAKLVQKMSSVPIMNSTAIRKIGHSFWVKKTEAWSRTITTLYGRMMALMLTAAIIVFCVLYILRPGGRFNTILSFQRSSNIRDFQSARAQMFDQEVDVQLVLSGKIDYSKKSIQRKLWTMSNFLNKAPYSAKPIGNWVVPLLQWSRTNEVNCTDAKFIPCLATFIKENPSFRPDIKFRRRNSTTIAIGASRFHLHMKWANKVAVKIDYLKQLREDLSIVPANIVSEKFVHLDEFMVFNQESLLTFGIATGVVAAVIFMFTLSPLVGFLLGLTLALQLIEAVVLIQILDIPLNQISFLTFFTGVVVSINSSIFIAQSFVISSKKSSRECAADTFATYGLTVLLGGVVTILGSISLGFGFPHFSNIFHFLLPLVLILGWVHAYFILPPLLSLVRHDLGNLTPADVIVPSLRSLVERAKRHPTSHSEARRKPKHPGVSIIGIGCRFPQAGSKDDFWDMLVNGRCAVGEEVPENRAEQRERFRKYHHPKRYVKGRLVTTGGAYLEKIKGFDAHFFGISPQEARAMDPQQRILLQVVYEAIEDAGVRLEDLQKCKTGVFVGEMNTDYRALVSTEANLSNIDQFTLAGTAASMLANRISFCFNFNGPSLSVNTSCSSSLTALKLACDSLHRGDCEVAIVCAPSIVLDYSLQVMQSLAGLLSPDGRCRSFDAQGSGCGRGEGLAAVILKLTEASIGDNDDIYCEVMACGMNSNGQSAVPITAPSSKLQAILSRLVLEESGLNANDIDYFEMHGHGSVINDTVEIDAIEETYCKRIPFEETRALRIGSVKSNLNHTESTSGLAGLVKVALMLKNQTFAPTVILRDLNPALKLEAKGLMVQHETETWNRRDSKQRVAAVNSFGFGGSNVHAIVREIPPKPRISAETRSNETADVITLSAKSMTSLQDMAKALAHWFEGIDTEAESLKPDLCYSLNERRTQHTHRLALAFGKVDEAHSAVLAFANQDKGWEDFVEYGETKESRTRKVAFIFDGEGSQWYAMGRQLISNEPAFKEAIIRVSNLLQNLGEKWSLLDVLDASEETSRIAETSIAQLAIFSIQYATAELLKSWGIFPCAVLGHSIGEFAAACTAGSISVEEAVRLVLLLSKLQEKCPSNGAMAALGLSEEKVQSLLIELRLYQTLDVAAVSDASSVIVSGDSESIECLGNYIAVNYADVSWETLSTGRAFHSFHMETIKKSFESSAGHIALRPRLSQIPIYSTVTGDIVPGKHLDASYWWKNIRCPVKFHSAVQQLLKDDHRIMIEISAQPSLANHIKQIALQDNYPEKDIPFVMQTLPHKSVPLTEQHRSFLHHTVCKLYTQGFSLHWRRIRGDLSARFIRLPTYQWQEKDYWYREDDCTDEIPPLNPEDSPKITQRNRHPFLERAKTTMQFSGLNCWDTDVDLHRFPTLRDHVLIQGGAVMPGATHLEMAFAMALEKFACQAVELKNVRLLNLLTLPEMQVRSLRLRLFGQRGNGATFQVSYIQDDKSELLLSDGEILADLLSTAGPQKTLDQSVAGENIKQFAVQMQEMPLMEHRQLTEKYGYNFGRAFSIIKRIWRTANQGLCLISVENDMLIRQEMSSYVIHPTILDACLQSCLVPAGDSLLGDKPLVPVGARSVSLLEHPRCTQLFCHVTMKAEEWGVFDIVLMSPRGKVLLAIKDYRVAELKTSTSSTSFEDVAFEQEWLEILPQPSTVSSEDYSLYVVLKDTAGFGNALIERLHSCGVDVIAFDPPSSGNFDEKATEVIKSTFENLPSDFQQIKVVSLWPAETFDLPEEFESIDRAQGMAFHSSVFLMQLLNKNDLKSTLYLVTRATQVLCCASAIQKATMPWGASVWGLRRTASLEFNNPTVVVVDLSAVNDPREVKLLKDEVRNSSEEVEIAYRQGKRYINRLVRVKEQNLADQACSHRDRKSQVSLCLVLHPGTKSLCVKRQTTGKLSEHDVEVDVLHCWHQSESLFRLMQSKSCIFFTGRVATLPQGSGHRLRVGDEICGVVSSGRFGNRVQLDINQIFPRLPTMSREQAATLPACLSIAYHAVRKLANERSGQRILIHEANRGPGLAALLIATALGHKAVCTSSADDIVSSRKMLLEMGAEQVVDASCSDLTEETGLFSGTVFFYDPLPNTVHQSCQVLKRGGKLLVVSALESGDIVLRADKFIAYERLDMASDFLTAGTFEKLCSSSLHILEQKGSLTNLLNLEHRSIDVLHAINLYNTDGEGSTYGMGTFSPTLTALSFASLQVDTVTSRGIAVLPSGLDEHGMKPNRTYLVVGQSQGIGFELGRWMVENGAKTVVLLENSVLSDPKKRELAELGRRSGSKILVIQGNISSPQEMTSLHQKLQALPSVAGIVLTAHVIKHEPINALAMQNFQQVMDPKVKGGFLLHQMSCEMELDFFVMFSSMTSLIGTVAQASSSSANAFLDSLAQYRRCALGKPGLAINWGPMEGTKGVQPGSVIARSQALSGFEVISCKQGIEYMKKVLIEEPNRSQICIADIDWAQVLRKNPTLAQSTRLERISVAENTAHALNNTAQSLAPKILLEKDAGRRSGLVLEYVKVVMSSWTETQLTTEAGMATSLCSFGIDSSAAFTLKIQFEANLQIPFEVPYFLQPDTTILKVAQDVNERLNEQQYGIASETSSDAKAASRANPGAENANSSEAIPTCKVVPLYTPDGSAVKLFCVHPSHRLASSLATIASGFQFQTTVSFYALGLTEPAIRNEDWGSVRELATKYVTLIRAEQRHGPYFLAGYSYGGLVAYEMACVLTEQEEVVEFLGMIDTFPWYPPSKSLAIKLTSLLAKDKLPERQVQVQFEAYLAKMAVETLKMTAEEYQALKTRNNQRRFMETLYQRARAMNVTMHDLEALYLSLLHDHKVASRTHLEWQPAEVRYPGRLTYLKGEDKKSTASPPTMEAHKAWAQVVNGNIDVYVCPGNHYSMAEQPHAQLVGGVLATAINFKYQSLFPELRAQPRSFKGRRAVQRFHSGVALCLHSKKGLKPPRVGEITLKEDKNQLLFRRRGQAGLEKTACKTIQLTEATIVLPGRYIPSAITVTTDNHNARDLFFGNLDLVASVVTPKRAFNLEFRDLADLKYFYSMTEAIFGTPIGVA